MHINTVVHLQPNHKWYNISSSFSRFYRISQLNHTILNLRCRSMKKKQNCPKPTTCCNFIVNTTHSEHFYCLAYRLDVNLHSSSERACGRIARSELMNESIMIKFCISALPHHGNGATMQHRHGKNHTLNNKRPTIS